jgi:thymidylate synthase
MQFVAQNINELYRRACRQLTYDYENEVIIRGQKVREINNAILQVTNSYSRIVTIESRKLSMRYLVGELCFYLSGSDNLRIISHYSKFWNNVSDDGIRVNSAYGKRIFFDFVGAQVFDGFSYCEEALIKDCHTRKAVLPIYNPNDMRESKDNPCTMYLCFQIRKGFLNLTVHMRSNDIWFGFPYDVAFFMLVQEIMVKRLYKKYPGLMPGTYTHIADNLHVYEKDFEKVKSIADYDNGHYNDIRMPLLNTQDVDSWFIELLSYERVKRSGHDVDTNEILTTPFQTWCIKQL